MRMPMLLLLLILSATVRAAEPADFIGLWGNETLSGPLLSGELVVDGRQTPWQASVAGMSATVERDGDRVRFAMPGGQGQFRGRMVGGDIEGFWIQPPGQGLASAYATPVALTHGEGRVWMAQLQRKRPAKPPSLGMSERLP